MLTEECKVRADALRNVKAKMTDGRVRITVEQWLEQMNNKYRKLTESLKVFANNGGDAYEWISEDLKELSKTVEDTKSAIEFIRYVNNGEEYN